MFVDSGVNICARAVFPKILRKTFVVVWFGLCGFWFVFLFLCFVCVGWFVCSNN